MLDGALPSMTVLIVSGFRVGGLMVTAPIFSAQSMPHSLRVVVTLVLAFTVSLAVEIPAEWATENPMLLIPVGMSEFLVGAFIGFSLNLVFAAFQLAAGVSEPQMGLGMSQVMDPLSGSGVGLLTQLYGTFGNLLFLSLSGHLLLIGMLVRSYKVIGFGEAVLGPQGLGIITGLGAGLFELALTFALPVLGVMLFAQFGQALLMRAIPQMNIISVGFIIVILAGFVTLGLFLPYMGEYFTHMLLRWFEEFPNQLEAFKA